MNGLGVLERMGELARSGQPFALATVVWRQGPSSSKQGSRAIITSDGQLDGWIGGACAEPVVIREAKQVIADGNARLLLLGRPDQFGTAVPEGMTVVPISCQSEGALEVYIEAVLPVPHLVIVGSSPMAHTLAQLARSLDWLTDLVSPREFTAAGAGQQWADERSMVIVATQGHGDEDMIERAAALRPAYLGLVASRRRGEAVLGYLAERGVPQDQLDRVHAPAGLDLGRTTHEEMAVAILAELVQLRAAGALPTVLAHNPAPAPRGEPDAAQSPGPDDGHRTGLQLLEAVDPVCGMTVTPDGAGLPAEYGGSTYYFCCAGCRRTFEESPDAYVRTPFLDVGAQ
jgi:xanthine dehydrogenase accessory factor